MEQRVYILLSMIAVVIFSLGSAGAAPARANVEDKTDTVLAEAAAKGFLITLTRPDLADTLGFYLLDGVSLIDVPIGTQDITGYELTGAEWVSDVTYRVKAILLPGNQEVAVYTGKYNGRWLVEAIDLPTSGLRATETANSVSSSVVATVTNASNPIADNGSGKLVLQTQSGGDIYLVNADGTGLQWVTTGIDPQLSPDGVQIAFTRWEPRYELFTINIDGSDEQAWTHGWRQMKSPTWSADGSKLTFSWQDGGRLEDEHRSIDMQEAARNEDGVRIPADAVGIERDGQLIEYTLPADTYWHLKQVDLDTGQLTDLGTENYSYGPTGHPLESEQIIFRGEGGLAMYNAQTNTSQPVTADHRDHTPVITPDGSQIAVSYWQDDHWEIHTMNIDGAGRQRLTSTPLSVLADNRTLTREFIAGEERYVAGENPAWNNAAPTWSPDGSKIAFLTDRTGQYPEGTMWEIWVMNANGSNQRPMFSNGALDGIDLNYAGVDERMLSWQ